MSNHSLNIALVSPGWPLSEHPNGIVAYIENLIEGLSGTGHQTVVLSQSALKSEQGEYVVDLMHYAKKQTIFKKLKSAILSHTQSLPRDQRAYQEMVSLYINRLVEGVKQWEGDPFDLIEIEESFGLSSYFNDQLDMPVVVRLHGPHFTMRDIMSLEGQWDYQLRVEHEGHAIRMADGVTSPSLDVLNQVRSYYDLELKNARVIPNAVPSVPLAERWDGGGAQPTILCVGRFDSHKGGDLIVDSFRTLATQNKDVVLNFVGPDRGVLQNGKKVMFEEYLHQTVPEASIRSRINFLGHQSSEQVRMLRKHTTITVVASRYENFPLSLLESLATGTPTICPATGGMVEIVKDGFNGLLAEPNSAESLADKALMLLENTTLQNKLSAQAVTDTAARFSPAVVAQETLAYYQAVIAAQ